MLEITVGSPCFKGDAGASVTAIPELNTHRTDTANFYPLGGLWRDLPISTLMRYAWAVLQRGDKKIEEEVFIVKDLATPLMGLVAILTLQMIPLLHNNDDGETYYRFTYPDVFTGLIKLKYNFNSKLKDSAIPYSLSVPTMFSHFPLAKSSRGA